MTPQQHYTLTAVLAGAAFALGAFAMYRKIKARYKKLPWWKRVFIRLVA